MAFRLHGFYSFSVPSCRGFILSLVVLGLFHLSGICFLHPQLITTLTDCLIQALICWFSASTFRLFLCSFILSMLNVFSQLRSGLVSSTLLQTEVVGCSVEHWNEIRYAVCTGVSRKDRTGVMLHPGKKCNHCICGMTPDDRNPQAETAN